MTRIDADWLFSAPSQQLCNLLTNAGHQALFVGGCVRNALLGAPVSDLDLSTDAHPETVMALAGNAGFRVVPTGIAHGTVTVVVKGTPFEITTFRRDVATDGRRATVTFASDVRDDARRRDFTMNALYAAADGTVTDPLNGLPDLIARRVRFIEDADQRIKEDYLRILRFFRFQAWYGDPENGPDQDGLAACADNVEGLQSLSAERVTSELLKLLAAPDPAPAAASMASTGALAQILPGADAAALPVLIHLEAGADHDPMRRLAALGGDPQNALRLTRKQKTYLDQIGDPVSHVEAAYRYGERAGQDRLLLDAAGLGAPVDPDQQQAITHASQQRFPLKASDLSARFEGAALGAALKTAERRWIASGFTLTKAQLLG